VVSGYNVHAAILQRMSALQPPDTRINATATCRDFRMVETGGWRQKEQCVRRSAGVSVVRRWERYTGVVGNEQQTPT